MGREDGPQETSRPNDVLDPYLETSGEPCLPGHRSKGEETKLQNYKEEDKDGPRVLIENSSNPFRYIRRESGNSVMQHI